ncbi:hypothetical protein [Pseudomonas putida]|uniref:hypothetical protein n=1 Tax=Pseudomonas putida TaxID=303 RepID=UPI0013A68F7B|nr:hypothetical protein [Pseudomonas putida]
MQRSKPEAMPPDECRSEGTPSLGEGPDAGASLFLLIFFLAFEKKVSRRKGETASGRYRRNGYVLNQQKPGRLSGRHRCDAATRQPSSHREKRRIKEDLSKNLQ